MGVARTCYLETNPVYLLESNRRAAYLWFDSKEMVGGPFQTSCQDREGPLLIVPAAALRPAVPKDETKIPPAAAPPKLHTSTRAAKVDGMQGLSSTETSSLGLLSIVCISVLVNAWRSDGEPLYASLAISGLAFAFCYAVIQWTGDVFMRRGFKGKDLSKKNPIEM